MRLASETDSCRALLDCFQSIFDLVQLALRRLAMSVLPNHLRDSGSGERQPHP